jgi:hypothetical protein
MGTGNSAAFRSIPYFPPDSYRVPIPKKGNCEM